MWHHNYWHVNIPSLLIMILVYILFPPSQIRNITFLHNFVIEKELFFFSNTHDSCLSSFLWLQKCSIQNAYKYTQHTHIVSLITKMQHLECILYTRSLNMVPRERRVREPSFLPKRATASGPLSFPSGDLPAARRGGPAPSFPFFLGLIGSVPF